MTVTTAAPMLDAALEYAERGVPVFPVWGVAGSRCRCGRADCRNEGKHPLGVLVPKGFQNATTDPTTIRAWWGRFPDANIGTPTSWCVVLDVDVRKGGDVTLASLEECHSPVPETPEVLTGGGGRHLYFLQAATPIRNSAEVVGPGLDVRGEGGYVLLPPSRHVSGRVYADELSAPLFETPLAPIPEWLLRRMLASAPVNGDGAGSTAPDWAALLEGVGQGQRHAVAVRLAGHFFRKGLTPAEVERILLLFAARCAPPFDPVDIQRIIRDLAAKEAARAQETGSEPDDKNAAPSSAGSRGTWPPAMPVPTDLLPVPAFDVSALLPAAVAAWVGDVAERAQCPPDFIGVGVIVSAASVVGRQLAIRPKQHDDWVVVPNLWGMVVSPSGVMKTGALQESQRGVRRLAADARERHVRALEDYEFHVVQGKAQRAAVEQQLKAAATRGESTTGLREAFAAARVPDAPVERRYVVNDSTVEKLGMLLNENPTGLLLFRDELSGFLRSMDREGHENDRAFFCEAWNGTGSYTYDRVGRGTLHIPAACISLLGGIQPIPLAAYLREAFAHGQDDGLIQRFQLMVYPDVTPTWRNVDRWPNTEARVRVVELFRCLDALDPAALAAHPGDGGPPVLHFTPDAQAQFDAWRAVLETRLRTGDLHPVITSHLAKYRSLMPSLALLFHVIDCVDRGQGGPVSAPAASRAIAWCEYLEPHACRIYETVSQPGRAGAATLARKLAAGEIPAPFTARWIRQRGWSALTTPEEISAALALLEDLGWVRPEALRSSLGGRPTTQYQINPTVRPQP